jgi:hypothetical protein
VNLHAGHSQTRGIRHQLNKLKALGSSLKDFLLRPKSPTIEVSLEESLNSTSPMSLASGLDAVAQASPHTRDSARSVSPVPVVLAFEGRPSRGKRADADVASHKGLSSPVSPLCKTDGHDAVCGDSSLSSTITICSVSKEADSCLLSDRRSPLSRSEGRSSPLSRSEGRSSPSRRVDGVAWPHEARKLLPSPELVDLLCEADACADGSADDADAHAQQGSHAAIACAGCCASDAHTIRDMQTSPRRRSQPDKHTCTDSAGHVSRGTPDHSPTDDVRLGSSPAGNELHKPQIVLQEAVEGPKMAGEGRRASITSATDCRVSLKAQSAIYSDESDHVSVLACVCARACAKAFTCVGVSG